MVSASEALKSCICWISCGLKVHCAVALWPCGLLLLLQLVEISALCTQAGDQSGVITVKLWSPASESPALLGAQEGRTVLSLQNVIYDASTKTLTSADCG